MRGKMMVVSHCFPSQGQLAVKSYQNALGRLSTVSLVGFSFFFFKVYLPLFFSTILSVF